MPPKGVRELILAGVSNEEVGKWLLDGYPSLALKHAKRIFKNNELDVNEAELGYLGMISAETMPGYAEACNRLGLTIEC